MTTAQRRECLRLGQRAVLSESSGQTKFVNGIEYDHKFIASTELVASDHGLIYVDAWRWDKYMRRPRWIANHDLGGWGGSKITDVSLGRGVHVAVETDLPVERVGESKKGLVVYVRYARTNFAQEVRALYDEGGLDDVSVRWDWRTEVTRNPYEEELQKFGEDLFWVAERADLVELSAVLLGADSGAQMVRGDVLDAFERCRGKGLVLPSIERMIHGQRPRMISVNRTARTDTLTANDALDSAHEMTEALKAWVNLSAPMRQQLADVVTALGNLVAADATSPVSDDESEESANPVADALAAVNEALADFDVALRDVPRAIDAIDEGFTQLGEALGVVQQNGQHGTKLNLNSPVNIPAIARDMIEHRLRNAESCDAQKPNAVDRLFAAYRQLTPSP